MKKRKNLVAKVVAFIALLAIVVGVIGTGLLVVVSSPSNEVELTQEELQEYIDSFSGSTASGSINIQEQELSDIESE